MMVEVGPTRSLAPAAGVYDQPIGTHLSRTLMLTDLRRLLDYSPATAEAATYRAAVIDENVLLKPTATTRRISFSRLRDLYILDPEVLLFQVLRELWYEDAEAQPLLALLCALARDVLLRSTAEQLVALPIGSPITPDQLAAIAQRAFPDRYSAASLSSLGRNLASSWQQSGHLAGKLNKVRARAICRPSDVVYALLLGYVTGSRGEGLFHTLWARVLDSSPHSLYEQAQVAAQRGWIEYRRAGDVVEVGFRHLMRSFQQGDA
jgi:hypothetical protein